MASSLGSSPHARGAHDASPIFVNGYGIIPACAGSTRPGWRLRADSRDHPRMRGEHDAAVVVSVMAGGSSPHARGAHERADDQRGARGIIPACAGSTTPPSSESSP